MTKHTEQSTSLSSFDHVRIVDACRDWLADCGCDEAVLDGESDLSVLAEVNRQYEGGLAQFVADDPELLELPPVLFAGPGTHPGGVPV